VTQRNMSLQSTGYCREHFCAWRSSSTPRSKVEQRSVSVLFRVIATEVDIQELTTGSAAAPSSSGPFRATGSDLAPAPPGRRDHPRLPRPPGRRRRHEMFGAYLLRYLADHGDAAGLRSEREVLARLDPETVRTEAFRALTDTPDAITCGWPTPANPPRHHLSNVRQYGPWARRLGLGPAHVFVCQVQPSVRVRRLERADRSVGLHTESPRRRSAS
jgi:hypothetical protein